MTKPTQATNFRKRQVLPAATLNRAIKEYGSAGGVVPYTDEGKQDRSMTAPLGTKEAPFGDAYFRGINIYTRQEVLQLVQAGKLGANNRFVFWNLDTNMLAAWDGLEIVEVGGSINPMEYLFGDGRDGNITMVSDGTYDVSKHFDKFVLNAGVTLTTSKSMLPIVLRCKNMCTIGGIINQNGKGFGSDNGYIVEDLNRFPVVDGGIGSTGSNKHGSPGQDCKYGEVDQLLYALNFGDILPYGGGGGQGTQKPGKVGFSGGGGGCLGKSDIRWGGAGGAPIFIFSPTVHLLSTAQLLARGADGQWGDGAIGASGGGGGSLIVIFCHEYIDDGAVLSVSGGEGGKNTNGNYGVGGNGGNGGIYIIKI